jgi:DNA ligase (NAD+)
MEIDGFGEIGAHSVVEYFSRDTVNLVIDKLAGAGVNMEYISTRTGESLNGKTIVVTGTLPTLSRDQAEKLIADNGGKAASSVSKKTSFVLAGEKAGGKLDKAKTLGIPVIDEEEFLNMINK